MGEPKSRPDYYVDRRVCFDQAKSDSGLVQPSRQCMHKNLYANTLADIMKSRYKRLGFAGREGVRERGATRAAAEVPGRERKLLAATGQYG